MTSFLCLLRRRRVSSIWAINICMYVCIPVNSINTGTITPGKIHRDYKRIEWASREKSRDKLNKSNGGSGI